MIVPALVAFFALLGLVFMLLSLRRMRRRRYGACAFHGVSALVFFLLAACAGLLGFNLLSYDRLTHEKHALQARFSRVGDRQFDAVLTCPGKRLGSVTRISVTRLNDQRLDHHRYALVATRNDVKCGGR